MSHRFSTRCPISLRVWVIPGCPISLISHIPYLAWHMYHPVRESSSFSSSGSDYIVLVVSSLAREWLPDRARPSTNVSYTVSSLCAESERFHIPLSDSICTCYFLSRRWASIFLQPSHIDCILIVAAYIARASSLICALKPSYWLYFLLHHIQEVSAHWLPLCTVVSQIVSWTCFIPFRTWVILDSVWSLLSHKHYNYCCILFRKSVIVSHLLSPYLAEIHPCSPIERRDFPHEHRVWCIQIPTYHPSARQLQSAVRAWCRERDSCKSKSENFASPIRFGDHAGWCWNTYGSTSLPNSLYFRPITLIYSLRSILWKWR